jgi:3',5'-cyclic AMP phosphodiesterase CpdA
MPELSTAHDAHLSLWQSAVEAAAGSSALDGEKVEASEPEAQNAVTAATAAVVEAKDPCVDCGAQSLPPHDEELATMSALHFELAEAELARNPIDTRIIERILSASDALRSPAGSIFRTAVGLFKVFAGKVNRPVYRNWKREGKGNIDFSTIDWRIPSKGRVALLSDWGTGYFDAEMVLRAAAAFDPDVIIHLGDIYFAGTELECRRKFLDPMRRHAYRGAERAPIPVYNMAGNHDYYSGGFGYHWLLGELNDGEKEQPASYFALRSEDDGWQFLATDTGYDSRHDVVNSHRFGYIPQPDEVEWIEHKLRTFGGRTFLLSHHQAFSNMSSMGGDEDDREPPFDRMNRRLVQIVEPYVESIAGWFWGHEHNLMVYKPYQGIRARCVGHSGRPVRIRTVEEETSWRYAIEEARLSPREGTGWLNHGFEIIDLNGRGEPADVTYYQVLASGLPDVVYREKLG